MALLEELDPEEARRIIDPALTLMMEAVHRYEGYVAQSLGDGIFALFGAPIAHEDHAQRALYAALRMQEAMRRYADRVRLARGVPLQIRVGLNTGEVVVRSIRTDDLHTDYVPIGHATSLAARMQSLANPGSIVVSASTLRLTDGYFAFNALGAAQIKGVSEPVPVYEVVGLGPLRTRLQVAARQGLGQFVGRQPELERMQQAWEQAQRGQGQMVAAVGEPGVGKSRLCYEFKLRCQRQGLVLEAFSVSHGKAYPYLPLIEMLNTYFQLTPQDDDRRRREQVTGKVLTLDRGLEDTLPYLSALLGVAEATTALAQVDPQVRRRRTFEAITRLLLRESLNQPVLLLLEDLHWLDSETQAWLTLFSDRVASARLLLLVNYRPEFQHGWGSKTYYTQLRLDPLGPEEAHALLTALLGDSTALQPLTQFILAKTERNPFFMEEMVQTLVDQGVLRRDPAGGMHLVAPVTSGALAALQLPPTVQGVLAARIDRLPADVKTLLQTLAVLGKEFAWSLLTAVADQSEDELQRLLAHLQAEEFLYEQPAFPESAYTFKHALTQEVAYNAVLLERRRVVHERAAQAIEGLFAERLPEHYNALAHHAVRGELWDKALAYCQQAGGRATTRSAYREAVAYFEQALAVLAHLPERHETLAQAIDLRFDLRNALQPLDEQARVLEHLRAAEPLAERLGDPQRLGRLVSFLSFSFSLMGEPDRAIAAGQQALALATSSGAFDVQVNAQNNLSVAYCAAGDFRQALDVAQRVVAVLTGELLYERFGAPVFPGILCRGYVVECLAELGGFVEGAERGEEAVRLAEAVAQPNSMIIVLYGVGLCYRRQGLLQNAISMLERGLALAQSADIPFQFPMTASLLSAAYALAGRAAEALPLLDQMLERLATGRHMLRHTLVLTELSEACLLVGRVEEASALTARLLDLSHTHTGHGYQAHACRLLGEVARRREPSDIDQAASHYRQALTLAEAVGMRPLQAHCHRGLGMLYAKTGQREQARTALSTAMEMYRLMEMTFWLPQTEAALVQVEGR
jgi:class 3 adenylate cyclase/tetratricopeptide (TPR) repeat protein